MSIKLKYIQILNEANRILAGNENNLYKIKIILDLIRKRLENYNWIGIYLLDRDKLKLLVYSGDKETQHKEIPIDKGLCGLAVRERKIINVPDVSLNKYYLECFPETKSELISPIFNNGEIIGEIDVDSYKLNAFNSNDEWFLFRLGELIKKELLEIKI